MILHLAEDEKFIDHFIKYFERVAPGKNIYLINAPSINGLKYIQLRPQNLHCFSYGSDGYQNKLREGFRAVVYHNFLHDYKWEILEQLPSEINHHWFSWGADLYWHPLTAKNQLAGRTRSLVNSYSIKDRKATKNWLYGTLRRLKVHMWFDNYSGYFKRASQFEKLMHRFDSISTVIPSEFKLIQDKFGYQGKYLGMRAVELLDEGLISKPTLKLEEPDQPKIILGNSSYGSNNHLDAVHLLQRQGLLNTHELIIPLSYGNTEYRQHLIYALEKLNVKNLLILESFMPIDEYFQLLSTCEVFVFYNIRQQAVGNILLALQLGGKVFLHPENPVLEFFKSKGVVIYSTEELSLKKLPSKQTLISVNLPILKEMYGSDAIQKECAEIVNFLVPNPN